MAHNCQEKLVLLPCLLCLCIPMLSPAWGLVRVQPLGGLVQHEQLWEKQPSKEGWKRAAGTRNWVRALAGAVYEGSALLGSLTLLISLWSELPLLEYSTGMLKWSSWRHELSQSSDPPPLNTWNILFFFSLAAFFLAQLEGVRVSSPGFRSLHQSSLGLPLNQQGEIDPSKCISSGLVLYLV